MPGRRPLLEFCIVERERVVERLLERVVEWVVERRSAERHSLRRRAAR